MIYTIIDTFEDIEKIRLSVDYYYLDQFANPYKETVFIANAERKVLKKINRDSFRPEMLSSVLDYYMADSITHDNK